MRNVLPPGVVKHSFLRLFHSLRSRPRGKRWARELNRESFNLRLFQDTIGYQPANWKFFFESLLHRSYLQFVGEQWNSNERLEFLGDAVLNFIVADYLHSAHPGMEEGELTKYRSRLVNRKILAQRAKEFHISDFLFLSSSAAQSIDSGSESILADAFEAIIGALYLDGGMKAARGFVDRTILSKEHVLLGAWADDNYKSTLLEYAQGRALGIPRYAVVREEGPEHDRRFTVEVFVGTQSYGVGSGRSKKDAEQAAAAVAISKISKEPVPDPQA
ncbi:MAG: ribonuclease III [Ignavibacteriales bacterium]|nr:ribonuclease III [Ignavibacteriales bacterium]